MKKRSITRLLVVLLLGLALAVPTAGTASAKSRSVADGFDLPAGFQPEGITIGPGPVAYFGSRVDGDIYAASLKTGEGRVISQGPGTASVGLKSDQRRYLYVAGGDAGTGRVVDIRTGRIVRNYAFASAPTFVNDVVLSRHAAWFTDSQKPQLYVVERDRRGRPASGFTTLPLTGDWVQPAGFGANGIALTPDRRALLVVQSSTGLLFRVNPRTGVARQVDLGGASLLNGDGLLVQGRILYAVQNRLNRVAVVKLNRSGTRGRLLANLTDPDFDVPTTVAAYKKYLYLPNARFTTPPTPTTPYSVVRIDAYGR